MAITIQRWSGREIRALREAKRMTLREFAGHLGVSERMISKWEAAGEMMIPRPVNQQALDTSLAASGADVRARFAESLGSTTAVIVTPETVSAAQVDSDDQNAPVGDENHVRHPVDGKLMTVVNAGVYFSGADNEPVYLPSFYVDIFPTTNADYARFVAATGAPPPQHWQEGKVPDELLDHPVVFVTWHDANRYARWAGKALPTSRQWEKAARGTRGDIYPWGSQRTPAKCNCRENAVQSTTPVDRYASGVSPYGLYDMCGNTWEWCSTETSPGRRELKGSAFTSPFLRCTPSLFNDASVDMLDDDTGFRCAALASDVERLLSVRS